MGYGYLGLSQVISSHIENDLFKTKKMYFYWYIFEVEGFCQ